MSASTTKRKDKDLASSGTGLKKNHISVIGRAQLGTATPIKSSSNSEGSASTSSESAATQGNGKSASMGLNNIISSVYEDLKQSSTSNISNSIPNNAANNNLKLLRANQQASESLALVKVKNSPTNNSDDLVDQDQDDDANSGNDVGSNGANALKKKRYTWTDDLHRRFMATIFDIGLKTAKPKALLALLQPTPEGLTTEHIKSHLQKYRANCQKTRILFLEQYDIAKEQTKDLASKALKPDFHAYPMPLGTVAITSDKYLDLSDDVQKNNKVASSPSAASGSIAPLDQPNTGKLALLDSHTQTSPLPNVNVQSKFDTSINGSLPSANVASPLSKVLPSALTAPVAKSLKKKRSSTSTARLSNKRRSLPDDDLDRAEFDPRVSYKQSIKNRRVEQNPVNFNPLQILEQDHDDYRLNANTSPFVTANLGANNMSMLNMGMHLPINSTNPNNMPGKWVFIPEKQLNEVDVSLPKKISLPASKSLEQSHARLLSKYNQIRSELALNEHDFGLGNPNINLNGNMDASQLTKRMEEQILMHEKIKQRHVTQQKILEEQLEQQNMRQQNMNLPLPASNITMARTAAKPVRNNNKSADLTNAPGVLPGNLHLQSPIRSPLLTNSLYGRMSPLLPGSSANGNIRDVDSNSIGFQDSNSLFDSLEEFTNNMANVDQVFRFLDE